VTRIRWTNDAADQLAAIVGHIREDNPEIARHVAQTILDRIAELKTFPNIGRPGERKGTRELVSPPYVIVYRVHHNTAEILYIWHGAQDWR
jgi:addiction module RelE/StbE family toxin